mmetsp:Transcript_11092/g.26932  ORF Transcript_11092/g.26932 Transcript_11092/m.26932 type:complete len:341 (+) Transcript_11092:144-1166(+)
MALRHRHHTDSGGAQRDPVQVVDHDDDHKGMSRDDDEEEGALGIHDSPEGVATSKSERAPGSEAPAAASTLTAYVGSMSDLVRNMDMQDVYRYWSQLRDWLSDVPRVAQTMGYALPPTLTGLIGWRGPSMTDEQLAVLKEWVGENTGKPYTHEEHWDMLLKLWDLSFPGHDDKPQEHDPLWKRLGFQGTDPATDFRAAGVLSVKCLLHFAEAYPDRYQAMMTRTHGKSAEESYPFACAGINVTFLLISYTNKSNDPDLEAVRASIARLLERRPDSFLDLFVVCMLSLDQEWVRQNGTYMRFPMIMQSIKDRSKASLKGHVTSVDVVGRDMGVDLYGSLND